ncbi:zinc ABC transporter substrate-binding protein [Nitrosopumilus sp.]|nr:zinc ABC transporter substrate-binding protein [Nitrosopumilus sp.]
MKGSQIGIIGGGIAAAVIIAVLFVSMGTQNDTAPLPIENDVVIQSEDKFLVYTTFYPLYQFTQGVAGDAADVRILIPSNGDPHSFELGPKTIVDLTKADMLIYNGAGFEPYIDEIMSSSDFDHIVFVDSSEGISLMKGEAHDHSSHGSNGDEKHDEHAEEFYEEIAHVIEEFEAGEITQSQSIEEIEEILSEHEGDGHGYEGAIEDIQNLIHEIEDGHMEGAEGLEEIHHLVSGEDVHDEHAKEDGHDEHAEEDMDHTYDPHIWLDPILAKSQVMTIADHLKESDPEHAEIYHDNSISYANQLDLLDQEIRSDVSSCAKDTFVPFHNAFSYFAERYDLNTLAVIQEFSPETPVTAKDIEELIHFAEDNDIKYFFTEENRNPRIADRLATELGGDILTFSPLESLAAEDDPDTTYFDKMRQNVDNLQIALECSS